MHTIVSCYSRFATFAIFACALVACEGPGAGEAPARNPIALHSSLQSRANVVPNVTTAKNVILFIGDGMGITTVTAARIFDGQSKGMSGEENVLPFETFPNLALIKTYTANQMVADSAGSATAMNTGVKTRAGVIGIGPEADRRSCEGALAHPLTTLGELAEKMGKQQESLRRPETTMRHRPQCMHMRRSVIGRAIDSCPRQTGTWVVATSPSNLRISPAATGSR